MEDDAFLKLWWQISSVGSCTEQKGIVRAATVLNVFYVAQVITVVRMFPLETDKLDVLEILILRIVDTEAKGNLVGLFQPVNHEYVKSILQSVYAPAADSVRLDPLLLKNFASRTLKEMEDIFHAIERSQYSTNRLDILRASVNNERMALDYDQSFAILRKFSEDLDVLLQAVEMLDPMIIGFSCREVVRLLEDMSLQPEQRLVALQTLRSLIVDPENRWSIVDSAFYGESKDMSAKATRVVSEMPPFPRSQLFGNISARNVVFVVDTSSTMSCSYETNQGDRIQRLRLVVRDLCRLLKEQLSGDQRFNVVEFSSTASVWHPDGLLPPTHQNLENASIFLRSLRSLGATNPLVGLRAALALPEVDAVYFVTDGPPSFCRCHAEPGHSCTATASHVLREIKRDLLSRPYPVKLHGICVLTGYHESDRPYETMKFVRALAELGGGVYRCIVQSGYIPRPPVRARRADAKRVLVSKPKGLGYQLAMLVCFLGMVFVHILAWLLPLGGQTCSDISRLYPTHFSPHPKTFAAWRWLLLSLGVGIINLCLPSRATSGIQKLVCPAMCALCVFNAGFIVAFQYNNLLLSALLVLLQVGAAGALYTKLEIGVRQNTSWTELFFLHFPVSGWLSWLVFHLFLTLLLFFKSWEWYGWGWQYEWSLFAMFVYSAIALGALVARGDSVFGMIASWALAGISRVHWAEARSSGDIRSQARLNVGLTMSIAATSAAIIIFFVSISVAARRAAWAVYQKRPKKQRRAAQGSVLMQTVNVFSFIVMVGMNLLATDWAPSKFGFPARPINHNSCGAVGRYFDFRNRDPSLFQFTIRIMPSRYAFQIFFAIYAWLTLWVVVQAIPYETLDADAEAWRRRDFNLDKVVMVRGCRTRRCCGMLPAIHRWRLTARAHHVFQEKIGWLFALSCVFNSLFLVAFQYRSFILSFVFMVLFVAVTTTLYLRAGVFAKPALDPSDDQVQDRDLNKAEATRRAMFEAQRLAEATWCEVLTLHIPLGVYLGWLVFLLLLSFLYTLQAMGVQLLWTSHGWAWATIVLGSLIVLRISQKKQDPALAFGFLWGVAAVAIDNTIGTCSSTSAAGVAIRQRGQHLLWDAKTEAECIQRGGTTLFKWVLGKCRAVFVQATRKTICDLLPTRDGIGPEWPFATTGYTKGYTWIGTSCVEAPNTCTFANAAYPFNSWTPEFVVAVAAIAMSSLLGLACLAFTVQRLKRWKSRQSLLTKEWNSIMKPDQF